MQMSSFYPSKSLKFFSKCVSVLTFFLIFAGGQVTSTGSGLAVPDWPLSYGMLFPPMVGGVFYEHGHRLFAGLVGFLTVILLIWTLRVEKRIWVKRLAILAMTAVILQGLLGGITVLFFLPAPVSMGHAILGQTFFLLTLFWAYSFSDEYFSRENERQSAKNFRKTALFFLAMVYVQLFLGALMRHTESGLAIPDFPSMAGGFWPNFNAGHLQWIHQKLFMNLNEPVTLTQVWIHFAHRCGALLVLISAFFVTWRAKKILPTGSFVFKTVLVVDGLVCLQILLGAFVIWTQKLPWVTTLHVWLGALILGTSAIVVMRSDGVPKIS